MAEFNKKDRHEKSEHSEKEQKTNHAEKEQEDRKPAEESKPEPKPYVHIDTFLNTAAQMYDLSGVQKAGFKAKMNGRHYQTDEQVFLKELKKHFNIDQDKEKEDEENK